jgi:hypothetical protein
MPLLAHIALVVLAFSLSSAILPFVLTRERNRLQHAEPADSARLRR